MASSGYSGTPLARKLGIDAGHHVALLNQPGELEELTASLPDGVTLGADPAVAEVTVLFVTARVELEARLAELGAAIFPDRVLWVAWPKRASKVATDMTEDVVREVALPLGLVDTKVCAIDATWSGLRLVWRRERRGRRLTAGSQLPALR